jgi:RNA polymerase sigma factor (sigma-70 family)
MTAFTDEHARACANVVGRRVFDPSERDDIIQEGMIAAWRELERNPDAPMNHLTQRAKMAAMHHVTGKARPTGSIDRYRTSPKNAVGLGVSMSLMDEAHDLLPSSLQTDDIAGDIADRMTIADALTFLDDRARALVVGVYLEGRLLTDVAAELGWTRQNARRELDTKILPALRDVIGDETCR